MHLTAVRTIHPDEYPLLAQGKVDPNDPRGVEVYDHKGQQVKGPALVALMKQLTSGSATSSPNTSPNPQSNEPRPASR